MLATWGIEKNNSYYHDPTMIIEADLPRDVRERRRRIRHGFIPLINHRALDRLMYKNGEALTLGRGSTARQDGVTLKDVNESIDAGIQLALKTGEMTLLSYALYKLFQLQNAGREFISQTLQSVNETLFRQGAARPLSVDEIVEFVGQGIEEDIIPASEVAAEELKQFAYNVQNPETLEEAQEFWRVRTQTMGGWEDNFPPYPTAENQGTVWGNVNRASVGGESEVAAGGADAAAEGAGLVDGAAVSAADGVLAEEAGEIAADRAAAQAASSSGTWWNYFFGAAEEAAGGAAEVAVEDIAEL